MYAPNTAYRGLNCGGSFTTPPLRRQPQDRLQGGQLFGSGPIQEAAEAHSADPGLGAVIRGALAEAT